MNAILITWESIVQIKKRVLVDFKSDEKSLMFTSVNDKYINVFFDNGIIKHYSEKELSLFQSLTPQFFYYIDFNSFELFKQFIGEIDHNCFIDNDCGKIYRYHEFRLVKSFNEF